MKTRSITKPVQEIKSRQLCLIHTTIELRSAGSREKTNGSVGVRRRDQMEIKVKTCKSEDEG